MSSLNLIVSIDVVSRCVNLAAQLKPILIRISHNADILINEHNE